MICGVGVFLAILAILAILANLGGREPTLHSTLYILHSTLYILQLNDFSGVGAGELHGGVGGLVDELAGELGADGGAVVAEGEGAGLCHAEDIVAVALAFDVEQHVALVVELAVVVGEVVGAVGDGLGGVEGGGEGGGGVGEDVGVGAVGVLAVEHVEGHFESADVELAAAVGGCGVE